MGFLKIIFFLPFIPLLKSQTQKLNNINETIFNSEKKIHILHSDTSSLLFYTNSDPTIKINSEVRIPIIFQKPSLIKQPEDSMIISETPKHLLKQKQLFVKQPEDSMIISETPKHLLKQKQLFVKQPEDSMIISETPTHLLKK